jgi:hypothetical protein
MANLYQDQIKKLAYYRSRIIQDFARKGVYPDDSRISTRLNEIDTMLGVFQYISVGSGDDFDTDKFNEDMLRILTDLQILYELAYEITVNDYNELKIYCETHLSQLQNMAYSYQYKTKFELDSTYLGNTLFFQSTGFDMKSSNGVTTINLGTIEAEAQSKLACIVDAENVNPRNVIFTFTDKDGIVYNCSPYSYNKDFFTVPGNLKVNSYTYNVSGDKVTTPFICTPSEISIVNPDNKYLLFGGKNFIQTGYYNKEYIEKFTGTPITLKTGGIARFYVIGGDYINFEFSTTPNNKNFEGNSITDMSNYHEIVIEHTSEISFDFVTNGTVYATRQQGMILNNEIYYPVPDQVTDILVEEYAVGDKVPYDVSVTAGPFYDGNAPVMNTIAIKQLSVLEEIS